MTENGSGRLYRSARAEHPEAIPALAEPVVQQRELSVELPEFPRERTALSATRIYLLVVVGTVVIGIADRYITGQLGILSSLAFVALSLVGAIFAERDAAWAGWTAPPIAFGLLALIYANIAPDAAEGFLFREVLGTLLALLALWELATRVFAIPAWMLPGPVRIAQEAVAVAPTLSVDRCPDTCRASRW